MRTIHGDDLDSVCDSISHKFYMLLLHLCDVAPVIDYMLACVDELHTSLTPHVQGAHADLICEGLRSHIACLKQYRACMHTTTQAQQCMHEWRTQLLTFIAAFTITDSGPVAKACNQHISLLVDHTHAQQHREWDTEHEIWCKNMAACHIIKQALRSWLRDHIFDACIAREQHQTEV